MIKTTTSLKAGEILTVVADAVSSGHVVRESRSAGEQAQSLTDISASTTTTFGPYTQTERFTIQSNGGQLSYSNAPAAYATPAQGTLADSAVQPRDNKDIIALTAATLSLTAATHNNAIVAVDRAAGSTITLPAATGSGADFEIFVKTTITSNNLIIKVAANTDDAMKGICHLAADTDDSGLIFEAAGNDTITCNGTTTGGIAGDVWKLKDVAAGVWSIEGNISATGTEATPFSEAISAP